MNKEMKFYSIGCTTCGGLQLVHTEDGMQFIPIFHNPTMAQLGMTEWPEDEESEKHPAKVIEIVVKMV